MIKVQKYKVRLAKDGVLKVSEGVVDCLEAARRVFLKLLADLPHEEVHALFLDGRLNVMGSLCLSMGGQSQSALLIKDIFRGAIAANAAAIVLGHNHPSGDPTPSTDDILFTSKAIEAGHLLGVVVVDHLVVVPSKGLTTSILPLVR